MFIVFLLTIVLLGALQPVQTSTNSKAVGYLNSPLVASLCSFMLGTLLLLMIILAVERGGWPELSGKLGELPWWAWCGGIAGAAGITVNILLFPKLGSMQTVLMPMVGQIIAGLIIDSFGLFDTQAYPFTLLRFLGFAAVMVGVFYVVSHKGKHFRRKDTLVWQFIGNGAGAVLAMQPAMNSRLSLAIGSSLDASIFSFASGTAVILLVCLLMKEHRPHVGKIFTARRPLYTLAGGPIGVLIVVGQTLLVTKVGVGLLTILNIFGMLLCSVLIDKYGFLGTAKVEITKKKVFGLVLVLAGIVMLNVG